MAKIITLRLSPGAHALIKEAAHRERQSMNQWLCGVIGVPPSPKQPAEGCELHELLNQPSASEVPPAA